MFRSIVRQAASIVVVLGAFVVTGCSAGTTNGGAHLASPVDLDSPHLTRTDRTSFGPTTVQMSRNEPLTNGRDRAYSTHL